MKPIDAAAANESPAMLLRRRRSPLVSVRNSRLSRAARSRLTVRSTTEGSAHQMPGSARSTDDVGGAERDRTVDLLNAIQALSQLSYGPTRLLRKVRQLTRSARQNFLNSS